MHSIRVHRFSNNTNTQSKSSHVTNTCRIGGRVLTLKIQNRAQEGVNNMLFLQHRKRKQQALACHVMLTILSETLIIISVRIVQVTYEERKTNEAANLISCRGLGIV